MLTEQEVKAKFAQVESGPRWQDYPMPIFVTDRRADKSKPMPEVKIKSIRQLFADAGLEPWASERE